jgi:hypothetical protein
VNKKILRRFFRNFANIVVDLHHRDADPYSDFYLDPTFHPDADPDPGFQIKAQIHGKVLK